MSAPPAPSEKMPRIFGGLFISLCAVVGPPVGLLTLTLISLAQTPPNRRALAWAGVAHVDWRLVYLFGGLFAVAAALIFIFFEHRFGRTNLWAALAAAVVAPVFLGTCIFLSDAFGGGTRLFDLRGVFNFTATCVCSMTVCWLLARLFGVVR